MSNTMKENANNGSKTNYNPTIESLLLFMKHFPIPEKEEASEPSVIYEKCDNCDEYNDHCMYCSEYRTNDDDLIEAGWDRIEEEEAQQLETIQEEEMVIPKFLVPEGWAPRAECFWGHGEGVGDKCENCGYGGLNPAWLDYMANVVGYIP